MKHTFLLTIFIIWIILLSWCYDKNSSTSTTTYKTTRNCIDVTSYDHDRNNDMKCTSSDWDVKYTSYEWARVLESL